MSNVLFINPCAAKSIGENVWASDFSRIILKKSMMILPQLSGMIFAALTPPPHTFTYTDEEIETIDFGMDVDLVALTAMTQQADRAYQIAGEFRKRGKTVVIGGIHASVMPDEVARHCDAVLLGEGENTWPAMLKDFETSSLKPKYDAKDYPPVTTMVSPRPDVIKADRYFYFPIQATKGCPYNCEFCSVKYSSGHTYRMKPVQQVVDEILAYEQYNKPNFDGIDRKGYYFVDDNLYVNREYVIKLMTALKPLHIRWDAQGSANLAKDEEVLKLMADCGCRTLSIGLESIQPESLREANKPSVNKVEEYETLIQNISKVGILPGGYFVFGFDSDDVHVFERTVTFIRDNGLLMPVISVLTPYIGTALANRLKDRVFTASCLFYSSWSAVFTPKQMTAEQLMAGARWVGIQTTRPKLIKEQLKRFWRLGPWERNPRLSGLQRVALLFIGLKMGLGSSWEIGRFLFWAAFQPDATDFISIVWAMQRYELSTHATSAYNPAAQQS